MSENFGDSIYGKMQFAHRPQKVYFITMFFGFNTEFSFSRKVPTYLVAILKKILKKKKIVSQNYTLNFRSKRAIHKVDALSFA